MAPYYCPYCGYLRRPDGEHRPDVAVCRIVDGTPKIPTER